jgi:hypothetical protein
MADRNSAYDHQGGITGKPDEVSPATEHEPQASPTGGQPNELRPAERSVDRAEDRHRGPTTHDDTRFTSKDEA